MNRRYLAYIFLVHLISCSNQEFRSSNPPKKPVSQHTDGDDLQKEPQQADEKSRIVNVEDETVPQKKQDDPINSSPKYETIRKPIINSEDLNSLVSSKLEIIGGDCIDSVDGLNGNRPLLEIYQAVYTKEKLSLVNVDTFNSFSLDKIQGVGIYYGVNAKNEFIDPKNGGLIDDNLLLGISHVENQVKALLPKEAIRGSMVNHMIDKDLQSGYSDKGIGWGWNSILYEYNKKIYEIVYFYIGAEWATSDGHFDGEISYISKAFHIKNICVE